MADFSALKTSIQNYIKQNGNEEITGAILQQILLSMVTALGDNAINDLVSALGDEVVARQNADGTLQDNIDSESTARSQADGTLQQNINNEATARENADGTLQTNINNEATTRGNADTELGGRITTLQGVVNGIKANIENGYVYAGIATPSTTPANGKVFYLALTAGTYTNFGSTVVPQGINILKYNGTAWSLDSFIGLDDAPTTGSNNFVKSGGVFNDIMTNGSAFDLSAYNNGTTYADLNDALIALNALPAAYKKGGMSMKFVQTSNNKYVQARCTANEFTTDVTKWQGIDDEPAISSKNLVESGGVESRLNKGLANDINKYIDFADFEYEVGTISNSTGEDSPSTALRRTIGYIPIDKLTFYYAIVKGSSGTLVGLNIFLYDDEYNFIRWSPSSNNFANNANTNASYIRITTSVNNSVETIKSWCLVDRPSYNKIVARNSFYIEGINASNRFSNDASFNEKDAQKIVNLSILRRAGLLTFKSRNICNPSKALRGHYVDFDGTIMRATNWETSASHLQVIDSIDPNTQYTIRTPYANVLYWYDENDNFIASEAMSGTTYTTISPSDAYILRVLTQNTNKGYVCIGSTLYEVDYIDGYVVKQELLPSNASGNYDFSNYVYEAIGDSRTAGYASNTNYNNNGEISSWPASPVDGYYQIMADGTYNGIVAEAGDGIVYSNGSAKLIKGGYSYITELGKIAIWPQGGTYPQIIHDRTGIVMRNHAAAGAAFCKRPQVPSADSITAYNQALLISPDTNIVTIFMGTNDSIIGADNPSLTQTSQNTRDNAENKYDVLTFKGAIRQTIKNIRLISPMAMIIFINENDGSQGYDGGSSKAQMIEEVAYEYRFPVLNLCHCGVDPRQDVEYLDTKYQSRTDGLHESTVGHNFLARVVGGEIKKYLW